MNMKAMQKISGWRYAKSKVVYFIFMIVNGVVFSFRNTGVVTGYALQVMPIMMKPIL